MKKSIKLTGLVVKIPKDFDLALKQQLINLEIKGIKRTKADEIIRLAQIGLLSE